MCSTSGSAREERREGRSDPPSPSPSDPPPPTSKVPAVLPTEAAVTSGEGAGKKGSRSCLLALSRRVTQYLEDSFESHGRRVASHVPLAVLLCLALTAACAVGSLKFSTELRPYRLWIPQDSEFIKVLDWQTKNFPKAYRQHLAIWEADNVLRAHVIQEMWRLHSQVSALTVSDNNATWASVCARVPSLPTVQETPPEDDYDDFDFGSLRRRRSVSHGSSDDLSLQLPRDLYCDNLSTLPKLCLETGLLEVWGLHEEVIMSLTDEQVLEDINSAHLSRVYGYKVNYTSYLGNVRYDGSGNITGAAAATQMWVSLVDQAAVDRGDFVVDQGSGEMVDSGGFAWEGLWVKTVLNDTHRPRDVRVYAQAASSFGSVSDENIWGDVKWLAIGFMLMTIFVNVMLGRRNLVEQRPMLAFLGLASVGQAVAISYGLCSMLGIRYCPVNSILPILLMGLGVDDMFVIMAAWEAAGPGDLVERAGRTMRHAGVAITVTSLTDVIAFAVGASTDLPALRSFCIYAATGIFAVYVLQATFFLAWLVRDQKRLEEKRHGMVWCITHENWTPSNCSQVDLMQTAFKNWFCPFVLSTPVRVLVLFGSGCLVASSVWATTNLRQEFNPMWFIPSSSYLYEAFLAYHKHFPEAGEHGYIYFANLSLPDDLSKLSDLTATLMESNVVTSVDAWFTAFDQYMTMMPNLVNSTLTYSLLQDTLSVFLQSSSGASYRGDFIIDGQLDCHYPAPPVTSFRIGFVHRPANSPADQAFALSTIRSLVDATPVQGYKAAWAQVYSIWETNEIVGYELWRNVILAGIVVGVVTLVLLASLPAALMVMTCVLATVLGVSATMWMWGLTIDTVSCIALVLAIGLSVDYAAHIAHGFLAARGLPNKKARAHEALVNSGSAVLQGGLSTLLSFVLLASSNSHVFITFFKVFTAASILGLYYGLVFLPVVLSIVGPDAYAEPEPAEAPPAAPRDRTFPTSHINQAFTSDQETTKDAHIV